jgi:hypothetical protein
MRDGIYFIGMVISALWVMGTYLCCFFISEDRIIPHIQEDGFFENISAIAFLATAVVYLIIFFKKVPFTGIQWSKRMFRLFIIIMALVAFTAFGEEISWGQRIFNFETPEWFQQANRQKEINLHNLHFFDPHAPEGGYKPFWKLVFTSGYLFNMFWLLFFVIIPLLRHYHSVFRDWINRTGFPRISIGISALFLFNFAGYKLLTWFFRGSLTYKAVGEINEANLGILFCLTSITLFLRPSGYDVEEGSRNHGV